VAQALGVKIDAYDAGTEERVRAALWQMKYDPPEGMLVENLVAYSAEPTRSNILGGAEAMRIPAIYAARSWITYGGLMSYSPQSAAIYQRGAVYVDKILRGARPADLPVEQPSVFDLVVNASTLHALGLTMPPSVAEQVTEWIN
jgi:putative ABC transport system substrate-binding protein